MTVQGTTPPIRCVGIDARYLSHGLVGGVHTYVRHLTSELIQQGHDWRCILYADAKAPFELVDLLPNVDVRILPWRNGASSARHDLRLGAAMQRDGVDLAHFPANYGFAPAGMAAVVTLHDAINVLPLRDILAGHPKRPKQLLMMTYLHLMTTAAMRRRPFVITDSEYSRREIVRRTGLPHERVHVIYLAHDRDCRPLDPVALRGLRARLGLRRRVLLADAIKNPDCTLRAYRALPATVRDETSLVFFARRPPARAVQAAVAGGECLLMVRPARDELVTLYNLADLFIFPSWYEGFGLPVLEAMACGTPVITSSRGSLPEVVGEGGIVVDAEDHDAIAAATVSFFADIAGYARLRAQALAWAAHFSWDRAAQQTLRVYEDAFLRRRPIQDPVQRRAAPL